MGRKEIYIISLIVIALISFFIGFSIKQQPEIFYSCKSAYDNLVSSELCKGKFQEYRGTNDVINNVEYFMYIWDESETEDYTNSIERRCYDQAETQFIKTGKRLNLINCVANQIEIMNNTLEIQCGCFFG